MKVHVTFSGVSIDIPMVSEMKSAASKMAVKAVRLQHLGPPISACLPRIRDVSRAPLAQASSDKGVASVMIEWN